MGHTGSPRLFLTSSPYSRCSITVFHSCFSWFKAGTTMNHDMYHKPSLLVGATVLFCTFAVPLSCSPKHLSKHQALILSSSSLNTSLRPDRATSCPLSWASMPVRLNSSHSICFINFVFLLFHICHTRSPIAVYISHVHKQHAL